VNSEVDIVAELDDTKGALYSIDQNREHKDVSYVHCRKGDQHSIERKTAIIRTGAYHFLHYLFCTYGAVYLDRSIVILNKDAEFCKQFIYDCIRDKYPKANLSILKPYKLISHDKSKQYKTGSFKFLRALFSGKDDPVGGNFIHAETKEEICHYELQKLISHDIASDIERLTFFNKTHVRYFEGTAY
jgi:hypothetical protein